VRARCRAGARPNRCPRRATKDAIEKPGRWIIHELLRPQSFTWLTIKGMMEGGGLEKFSRHRPEAQALKIAGNDPANVVSSATARQASAGKGGGQADAKGTAAWVAQGSLRGGAYLNSVALILSSHEVASRRMRRAIPAAPSAFETALRAYSG
jgi:hypothetical protein